MFNPEIEGKVFQVVIVDPDTSTEGNVSQVAIVGGSIGAKKVVIEATGDSGTFSDEEIAQIIDDTLIVEINCDGQIFRLSNNDSTLSYRTFTNLDSAITTGVEMSSIYVQLESTSPTYKKWTKQKEIIGTGFDETKTQVLKNVQGVLTWVDEE